MLISKRPRVTSFQDVLRLAANEVTKGVTYCLPLNGSPIEIVTGKSLTLGAGGSHAVDSFRRSLRGTGSSARASIALDLSAFSKLSVSFWLNWDSFSNNETFAFEFGGVINGGLTFEPNTWTGRATVYVRSASSSGQKSISRPTGAAWHHYAIVTDRSIAGGVSAIYVDGESRSLTTDSSTVVGGLYANSTLYLLSRAGTSNYGLGSLANIVFRGNYVLSQEEARYEFRTPWRLFAPRRRRFVPYVAAAGGAPTITALSARLITTTSAQPRISYS